MELGISQTRGYESVDLIKIENKDGVAVVSSRVVANDFGKRHCDVLRDIENLIDGVEGTQNCVDLFIESQYQHPQNKQWYKEYLLTRDGFSLLVMGFTGKEALQWKLKYIEAFNKMEETIKQAVTNPYANLSPELQMLIKLEQGHQVLERNQTQLSNRMTELEENACLTPGEYGMLGQKINTKVHSIIKERGLTLNRQQRSELYKSINRDIKVITGVQTRSQLRQKHLEPVLDLIYHWEPSLATMMKVNQMSLAI